MKYFFLLLRCAILIFTFAFAGQLQAQCPVFSTLYVDSSVATTTGNGSSWGNAYRELRQALNVAGACNNITIIYVAKGTYRSAPVGSSNRDTAFTLLRGGLKIFGGYAAGGSTRNVAAYPTVLSGDVGIQNNTSDNSYHVVVIAGLGTAADSLVLDGFTITGGNASTISDKKYNGLDVGRSGGGGITMVANNDAGRKVSVRNCTFTNNYALENGGGMGIGYSAPDVRGCSFLGCTGTEKGGGIYTIGSYPNIDNCSFTNNSSKDGAGIYNNNSSYAVLNSVFSGNNSSDQGGAMFNYNSTIIASISNCTFSGNSSYREGGGVYNQNSSPTIVYCVFSGNSSSTRGGGGMYNAYSSAPYVVNSFFSGNSANNNGGGMFNFSSSSPKITNCVFEGNNSGRDGGGMCNSTSCSPTLTNCTFYGNTGVNSSGFMYNSDNSSPVISNCVIRSNTPLTPAIVNVSSSATVTYSLIQGGYAGTGNANANALFVNSADPNGPDNVFGTADDGLALQPCSPAVNTGNNSVVSVYVDITGAARVQAGTVDMGAYETAPLPGEAVLAGSIGNPHIVTKPQEYPGDSVSSVTAPSPLATISWQQSTNNGSSWIAATPAGNQLFYKFQGLQQTTLFRRVATVCDVPYYSNTVEIKVVYPNGVITGRVASLNGTGIQGVQINVTRTTTLSGGPAGFTYTAFTGTDGRYSVNPIYYGDPANGSANFTVKPSKPGHIFNISSINKTLNYASTQETADFTDNTALSIIGRTYQRCTDCYSPTVQTCPIDSINIFKGENGDTLTLTYATTTGFIDTAYGRYAIGITNPTKIRIEPRYTGHSFSPAHIDSMVNNNVSGIDFNDTTTHVINGKFTAGCSNYIGTAVLEFTDVLPNDANGNPRPSCFRKRVTTDLATGLYSIRLPVRKYRVQLISFTPATNSGLIASDVVNFINTKISTDSLTRDITSRDTTLNITYVRPPVIAIKGLNLLTNNCNPQPNFALIRQAATDSFKVTVFQGDTTLRCPLSDTAKLIIMTNVQQEDQVEALQYAVADTGTKVKLKGGTPNITGSHLKTLTIGFTDRYGRAATSFARNVLVTGVKSDTATFTTVSPELPLVVLHDPPGDASSSTWRQSQTISNALRFYSASAVGGQAWVEAKIGASSTVGIGVATDISVWGTIRGTIGINSTNTSSNETILTTTTSQNFSTSGNPNVTGNSGDVYVGAAINLKYAVATDIAYNYDSCKVTSDRRLIMANNGFATQYIYSEDYITKTLIPNLQSLALLSPDSAARYLNQVKVWQQVVANNAENKRRAAFVQNYSFDGSAGPYTNTTTTTSSKTSSIQFATEINAEVAAELGFETAGSGVSGGLMVNFRMETGNSETNTTVDETTISYTLDDNTPGDYFSVDVKKDPVYNTPVFELKAGTASCPIEPGAQPRDAVYLTAVNPVAQGLNPSSPATFNLKVVNTSPSSSTNPNDKRTYKLNYVQSSNVANETITIAGSPFQSNSPYILAPLGYLDSAIIPVSITRQNGSLVYSYESERFTITNTCDEDLGKTVAVSAYFTSPCSNITLAQPADGWVLNAAGNNQLFIKPSGYDPATLTSVNLQYSTGTGSTWMDGPPLTSLQLTNGFYFNTVALPDGPVNVRLRLDCSSGTTYSQRAMGIIDRKAPQLYGRPTPTDDNYVNGDIISFTYNENLNTGGTIMVMVKRLSNGQTIPATVTISDNKIVVTPTGSIAGLTGDSIRVIVSGVSDVSGNIKAIPDTIRFTVGTTVTGTGNQALFVTISNPTVYKNNDTSAIKVVFNLPAAATNDTRVNYSIGGTARYNVDYAATYTGADALYASFNGTTGSIKIPSGSTQATLTLRPIAGDTSLSPDKTIIISATEGGDYSLGTPTSVTGYLTTEDGIYQYIFTGDGNWNIRSNWQNNNMPLTTLVAPKEIIINPSGTCLLNIAQTIKPGAKITVKQNRRFVIQSSLKMQ